MPPVAWRPAGVLVEVRCPGRHGHTLAFVYRTRDQTIWLRTWPEGRRRPSDRALRPSGAQHLGLVNGEPAIQPGPGGFRDRCRCGGYGLGQADLINAADRALSEHRVIRMPAQPQSGTWLTPRQRRATT